MMNKDKYIPQGYKPSPLGPIPEDWEVKRLGEVVTVNSGKDYKHLSTGNIPVYGTGGYMLSVNDRLSDIDAVGIGRKGTIDKPQYLRAPFWTVDTLFFLTTKENYDLRFVFNLSQLVEWKKYSEQTGVPSLTSKSINNIQIPVPPLPEQHRIVSILELWVTAIAKQTTLIEQLTLRKRGLMQQLLTGKKRLEGFSGEWKEVRLGEVFDERNETNCDNLPLLSITGDKGVIYQSESDKRDISNEDKSKYKHICPNDIGYNTMRMWQGRSALSGLEGIVSPAYTIVTPKNNIDVRFMAMLIQQPRIVYSFWTHSQGLVSDTLNCKYPDFCQVKVVIPSKEEQTAVADFFVEIDKEIEIHKQKLAAMQEQKRGLMQVLLSGKRRIKIN